MKTKLLKKIRKRYTIEWRNIANQYDRLFAIDNELKKVHRFKDIHDLVEFMALFMLGEGAYDRYLQKVENRKQRLEYYKVIKQQHND